MSCLSFCHVGGTFKFFHTRKTFSRILKAIGKCVEKALFHNIVCYSLLMFGSVYN